MHTFAAALVFLTALSTYAQDTSNPPTNAEAPSPAAPHARGRNSSGKRLHTDEAQASANTIHGNCTVAASDANPLTGPCVNLLLVLNDTSGNEVEKTRTSEAGYFEFNADKGKSYKIVSGSRFYDIAKPDGTVQGGTRVDLWVKLKP